MKKLYSLLLLAACVFCMTACASENVDTTKFTYDEASYTTVIEENLKLLSDVSDTEIVAAIEQYGSTLPESTTNMYNSWMAVRPEVGEYVGVLTWDFEPTAKEIVITAKVDYSLRDAEFKISFLKDGTMDYCSFNPIYTLGEKMSKAGLNTVIGMGVVFVVLYFISVLIGCFKFINKLEQSVKSKKENKTSVAVAAVDNTIAQIVQKEEEELVDDLELVAVIAAAIAAHTGTSTDGFVVRSIKKSNRKKWLNA